MGVELKPCPFCGGAPYIQNDTDIDGCYWSWVSCRCGARTRGKWSSSSANTCPQFYAEVRDEWNTRHGAGDVEAWLPIESAPDDGTPFLAYLPKEGRTIQVGWQNKNGVMAIGSSFSFDLTPATHWRPLPAAPTDEAARADERG